VSVVANERTFLWKFWVCEQDHSHFISNLKKKAPCGGWLGSSHSEKVRVPSCSPVGMLTPVERFLLTAA